METLKNKKDNRLVIIVFLTLIFGGYVEGNIGRNPKMEYIPQILGTWKLKVIKNSRI